MKSLRILHVISSVNPEGGGVIEGVLQLQRRFAELGVRSEIVCCDPPDASWLKSLTVPVHALGPGFMTYRYSQRLRPWLRANVARFDAVTIEGIWQYHSFAAWRVLRRTGIPYFVFTHGMLDPWFKHAYPFKHLKKSVYWPWTDYRVLRDATAVLFTCEEERLLARRSFPFYRAREAVVGYGTATPPDADAELFLREYPELRNKRLILFMGRIHQKKGCDLLLDAFAQVAGSDPRLHLAMVGPDQLGWTTKLKAQAERLGIAHRITWTGMVRGEMKWAAYSAAEVFCLPSHQENFGIVVAEALACGKPPLMSNKVNIWREVHADGAGFVAEDTVQGTLCNLQRWLAMSPHDYSEMSNRARRCFGLHFHADRAADRLVGIIQANLDSTGARV